MQDNGMKLHHKASGRSCFSKRSVVFKMKISSKKSGNTSYKKRYNMNQRSRVKKVKRNGKTAVEDLKTQKLDKRRRRNRRKENQEQDEASRLQRRTRYLVIKMKLEQNLIEAYSGEGWNGQSREKIKPVKELQRAMKQILKCKLGIRDAIRQLDQLGSEGCIEESVFGPDGSVFHEHIFCAKCKLRDAFPDNDIILCDGTCNCAFHQKCLEPPLATENIPPEDQGWFCKYCECKIEIIDAINAHLGTHFSAISNWQDIFKEAAMANEGDNASLIFEEEWPSDEPEDDDYDPERNETSCSRTGSEDNMHDDASSSSSFSWTSEEEGRPHSRRLGVDASTEEGFYQAGDRGKDSDRMNFHDSANTANSEDTTDLEITGRRRQRRDVDYRKLHDEMFGKEGMENEQASEDEDWGPSRRRRRLNETDAAGTLVTLCGVTDGSPDVIPSKSKEKSTVVPEDKRKLFRIPRNAVEKLRIVFAENELPSRAVKETLSKQLGIASEKINKWFKNARYAALKTRKEDGTKQLTTSSTTDKPASAKRKSLTADFVESSSPSHLASQTTGVQIAKYLRRVRKRKNPAPKPKQRRTSGTLQTSINEVNTWFSDAASLKRKIDVKGKSTLRKRVIPESERGTSKDNDQLYINEMERLFLIEAKLAELKEVISRTCNGKNEIVDQSHSGERIVMHVPVVTVKEKR